MKHGMIALLGVGAVAPLAVFAAPSPEVVQAEQQTPGEQDEASSESATTWLNVDWDICLKNLMCGTTIQVDIQGPPKGEK